MATYQDRNGKVFKTREEAKASNQTGSGSTTVTQKSGASKKLTDLSVKLADEYYTKNPQLAKSGGYRGRVNTNALLKKKGPSTALKNLSVNLAKGNITGISPTNENTTQGVTNAAKATPLGEGTPLTDAEITALEKQGYREGDFVPNRGRLLPDGTFDTKGLTTASNLRAKETTVAQNAVVSDTPIIKQEDAAKTKVESASVASPTKDALTLLDEEMKRIKDDLRSSERNVNAQYKQSQADLQAKQSGETGQQSVALAEAGGYLGFSGGAQGVMLSLAQTHRAELADLDARRKNAIQAARDAAANRRYDVVRLKAAEIERIDQETYDRQEKYNTEVKAQAEKDKKQAEDIKAENDIFTAIKGGAKTAKDIFEQLGGGVEIKKINDFLTGITKGTTGSFKFSSDETANFLGSGMSTDDISALNEYVNENGYTEEVRKSLTPRQRAVADKVYGLKTGKTSGDVAFTLKDGTNISTLTSQVMDGFTKMSELTPTMAAKVRSELYALGFSSDSAPEWFDESTALDLLGVDATKVEDPEAVLKYYAINNLSDYRGGKITKQRSLNELWKQFRGTVLNEDSNVKNTASVGGIPTNLTDL